MTQRQHLLPTFAPPLGVHCIYFGCGNVPSRKALNFTILVYGTEVKHTSRKINIKKEMCFDTLIELWTSAPPVFLVFWLSAARQVQRHTQGRSYIGGAGGAAPPLAISQSANQVKVTLSRQIEKIPEICTLI